MHKDLFYCLKPNLHSGGFHETFGARISVGVGSAAYVAFVAATRLVDFSKHRFVVDALLGCMLGTGAALFWAVIGGVLTAYPAEGQQV